MSTVLKRVNLFVGFVHSILSTCCRCVSYNTVRYNSNRCALSRVNRTYYAKMYPTVLVQPDGSTVNIRYKEPRKIIKLPLDLSTLTEAERKERVKKRHPKQKIVIEEEIEDDSYSVNKYKHLWKKK